VGATPVNNVLQHRVIVSKPLLFFGSDFFQADMLVLLLLGSVDDRSEIMLKINFPNTFIFQHWQESIIDADLFHHVAFG